MSKKVTFLGTGTSSGIPTIGCRCPVCTSTDEKDKRLRASILIQSDTTTILIDTTPDFRQQMLKNNITKVDAVLYTHHHFDHIGGFDDLRAINYTTRRPVPIYLMQKTFDSIKRTFFYAFGELEQIGGGIPAVDENIIDDVNEIVIGDIKITPIPLMHGKMKVLGFRIDNFAYCTDTNFIPDTSFTLLRNLDVLVLDALRYTKHETHFSLDEALETAKKINANATYFTHMAHEIKHTECEQNLPKYHFLSFDGLVIKL